MTAKFVINLPLSFFDAHFYANAHLEIETFSWTVQNSRYLSTTFCEFRLKLYKTIADNKLLSPKLLD